MNSKPSERGQALILIVFAAIVLFGFAALAIDGSRVFSDRRHAQNAADTAVLAAALAQVRGGDYADAAVKRAESNGFNLSNSNVEVHLCNEGGLNPPCEGLPADADASQYIQVVIRMSTPTTFARVLGRTQVDTVVSAIARAVGGGGTLAGGDAALAGLEPVLPNAVSGNGNVNLTIENSGVFSNSTDPCGLNLVGTGIYTVEAFNVVSGTHCVSGSGMALELNGPIQGANRIPYPPTYNIDPPTFTCLLPGLVTGDFFNGYTVSPGNHANLNLPNGIVTFLSGDHCFTGGVTMNANTDIEAHNVKFWVQSGSFDVRTNGYFNCSNVIVYINGSGTDFNVNGTSSSTCTGITFYVATGTVSWNGNPTIDFTAPSEPTSPYKGLLIYLPVENSSPLTINGNSNQTLTGSIIAAGSPVTINGNSGTFALSSQITGRTIAIGGNGNIEIRFNPAQQFARNEPPMIQLTK